MYKSNSLYTEELFVTRDVYDGVTPDLDEAISRLPVAYWAAGGIMADSEPATMMNMRISLVGSRSEVLIFNPLLAHELGWHPSNENPFTFVDSEGTPMVRTRLWRDGWQQEMKHARVFRWSEGQRVELTEKGQSVIERDVDLPRTVIERWRRYKPESSKPELTPIGRAKWTGQRFCRANRKEGRHLSEFDTKANDRDEGAKLPSVFAPSASYELSPVSISGLRLSR